MVSDICRTVVGILSGFHFDLTQVGVNNDKSEDDHMEVEVQDEAGEEDKMSDLVEELGEDVKSLQEGEECN